MAVGLLIVRPIACTVTAGGSGVANLLTPSPREIWIAGGAGAQSIDIDLLSAQPVDCFDLGFTNARADAIWTIQSIASIGGATVMIGKGRDGWGFILTGLSVVT